MATIYFASGEVLNMKLSPDVDVLLDQLQSIVEGPIEVVPIGRLRMVIHEEGKLQGLPTNFKATLLAEPYLHPSDNGIAGNAIVASPEELGEGRA